MNQYLNALNLGVGENSTSEITWSPEVSWARSNLTNFTLTSEVVVIEVGIAKSGDIAALLFYNAAGEQVYAIEGTGIIANYSTWTVPDYSRWVGYEWAGTNSGGDYTLYGLRFLYS